MRVSIEESELARLQRAADLLDCLEACGVDNWEGWSDAHRMLRGEEAE